MATKRAPPLDAPPSDVAVKVSVIDTTMELKASLCKIMWSPEIKGFETLECGTFSFLVEHPSGRKLVYDLGCRKDWENLPPALDLEAMTQGGMASLKVDKNISEILTDGGIKLEDIEAIIWSHWHFDHTGDPSTFPSSTKVIVGEGFKKDFLPGYPADPKGHVLESDFEGRELMEVDFSSTKDIIGGFKAFDYFGDGSFYILDSPGHAIGHVNALARTNASPTPDFIHFGGDSLHHVGEIRPSEYIPLPQEINPSPVPDRHASACPGHFFTPVLREESNSKPILEFQDPYKEIVEDAKFGLIVDEPALRDTVKKDEKLDANEDVFTIIAHDWSLKGILDEWPKDLNSWKEKGWKESTRWNFLRDFQDACA